MSAAQKIQQHPLFIQAQNKALLYHSQLDKELSKYPICLTFEQRTQVPKTYAFLCALTVLAVLHAFNAFAAPLSNLVGWGLPAYLSFRAIESASTHDDTQWLTYWVVFGFLNFLESLALRLILYYVPWYYALKTTFVLWLQLPASRGAHTTYLHILKPLLSNFVFPTRAVVNTAGTNRNADE